MKDTGKKDTNNSQVQLRIVIITLLQRGEIGQGQVGMLRRFSDILGPSSSEFVIIDGHTVIDGSSTPIPISNKKPSKIAIALKQISCELLTSIRLLQVLGRVDFVIYFLSHPLILPTLLAKATRKKTVFIVTGLGSRELKLKIRHRLLSCAASIVYRMMENACFKLVDKLAVESESILSFHGLDRYRSKSIVFGASYIDTSLFRVYTPLADRKEIVGYIGRLSSEKGIMVFIEAITLVLASQKNIRFLIVGDGLLNLFERDVSNEYEITWPNAAADVWSFSAFVTGYEPSADFDAALEASITLKITGVPTFA